ncbi:MAG: hypothetical protein K9K32_06320 [Halanaerobiales bacterium]|nr:hypothetical protein [Halanaerobiales bacterium]
MNTIVNKEIKTKIDFEQFLKTIKVNKDYKEIDKIKSFFKKANQIAVPKAIYGEAYIDQIEDEKVIIEKIEFKSKIMSVNLKDVHKVIVYIVTAGKEIDQWAEKEDGDILQKYWLSVLQEFVLKEALNKVKDNINKKLLPGLTSTMNPGSLIDWSITEQKKLFELIGDPENKIGVSLTKSSLMLPKKSVSGLIYPTEISFENCQVCPRKKCPNRSAPYQPELLNKKYS